MTDGQDLAALTEPSWSQVGMLAIAFVVGVVSLIPLEVCVYKIVARLRKQGGLQPTTDKEQSTEQGLARLIGRIEQPLFYFVTFLGAEAFATLAAGWLLLKGIHQWQQFRAIQPSANPNMDAPASLDAAGLARNRFLVFAAGSALAIAAGGLAGAVFHGVGVAFRLFGWVL